MSKPSIITTAGLTLLAAQGNLAVELDYNQAPPNLTELTGTELYHTWRPKAHVTPIFGRMQDPCAHYTDPQTGSFHVGYLWNSSPGGITACKTDDLVTYEDVNPLAEKVIARGGKNDPLAIFDGSVVSKGIDGYPTLMYSGVKFLPITWSMSYTPQSETQSIAVSRDGGHTFEKLDHPPVIVQPEGIEPTAFRDPYMFNSYQLDSLLGSENGTWYVTVSGGVKGSNPAAPGWEPDAGPGQFLYRQQTRDNFLDWEYLGMWWREVANSTSSNNSWAVSWGFNMETANLANLDEHGINSVNGELFHLIGAEYSTIWDGIVRNVSSWGGQFQRHGNWATGTVSLRPGTEEPVFTPTMALRLGSDVVRGRGAGPHR
jgi:beta-fructofuranosidase